MERRKFLGYTAAAGAALMLHPFDSFAFSTDAKLRLAQVGTGHRGSGFWGKDLLANFKDRIEFVGLSDINPGRLAYAKSIYNTDCPTFANFDEMLQKTKPDYVIVTTVDATHDEYIVKALEAGCNVITEKPMTTDEVKCQRILEAEKRTGKKVVVASPQCACHATKGIVDKGKSRENYVC